MIVTRVTASTLAVCIVETGPSRTSKMYLRRAVVIRRRALHCAAIVRLRQTNREERRAKASEKEMRNGKRDLIYM